MIDKKKFFGIATCLLGLTTVFGVISYEGVALINAENASYTLVYDADHRVVGSVIETVNGSDIWTKANYNAAFTDNGIEFTKDGYLQNLSPLQGITSVNIVVTSGSYIVSHGFIEPKDLRTPFYEDQLITESTTITYSGDNLPNHIRVLALEAGTLESVTITYNCNKTASIDPNLESIYEGLENAHFSSSYYKGRFSYTTDSSELCQTSYATSKRALKVTHHTKNETLKFVDVTSLLDTDYLDREAPEYLIIDVKSNSSRMGAINPFMFNATVSNSTYNTGWQDPDGFFALPDNSGWYRYYWRIDSSNGDAIPFEYLQNIGIILTDNEADDLYYVFDNIRLGMHPGKMYSFGNNYDMVAADKFEITANKVISFDYKANESDTTVGLKFGNWTNYYRLLLDQNGKRKDNGDYYKGSYSVALANGWIRVFIDCDVFNYTNNGWKVWNFTGTNDTMKIIMADKNSGGNDATGYLTAPVVVDESLGLLVHQKYTYEHWTDVDLTNVHHAYLDYKIIGNYDLCLTFMMSDNWNTYYGYFEMYCDGSTNWDVVYSGVTITKQGGGVVRMSFDFASMTKTSSAGAPTGIDFFYVHATWGGACGVISDLIVVD